MFRKILAVSAVVCGVAAGQVAAQEIPLQFRLGFGARTLLGDERPYSFDIPGRGVDFDPVGGETFIKDEVGFGLYFASETRIDFPVHIGVDVDVTFGTEDHMVVGVGGGLGFNTSLGNGLYAQAKVGLAYAMSFRDMGKLHNRWRGGEEYGYYIGRSNREMFDPQVEVTTSYFMMRPEVNLFFRVAPQVLLFGGVGYQFALSQSDIEFMFTGEDWEGNSFSESLKSNNPAIDFTLGNSQNPSTSDASPQGFVINIGIAYHL